MSFIYGRVMYICAYMSGKVIYMRSKDRFCNQRGCGSISRFFSLPTRAHIYIHKRTYPHYARIYIGTYFNTTETLVHTRHDMNTNAYSLHI